MNIDPSRIYRLDNAIQAYEWGSPTAIPELLGRANPSGAPQAELWMGAHPKAPSRLVIEHAASAGSGTSGAAAPAASTRGAEAPTLDAFIAAHPEAVLGTASAERFGSRLPFLFKVLAASKALSIQAHPNVEQARAGFERENRAGIPIDAPNRNYRDDNHKPEIICALTRFWAMRGFRPIDEILDGFARVGLANEGWLAALRAHPDPQGLRTLFSTLMELPAERRVALVERTAAACSESAQPDLRGGRPASDAAAWIPRLAREFPGDIGALAPLYLNVIRLEPGEAMFLPAGELHAYLEGTGIELMANSDNVLRGGLTPKHVDLPELLSVLSFTAGRPEILRAERHGGAVEVYGAPSKEFRLSRITLRRSVSEQSAARRSIELLICTEGGGELSYAHPKRWIRFAKGDSFVIPAAAPVYRLDGEAVLYRADVPPDAAGA